MAFTQDHQNWSIFERLSVQVWDMKKAGPKPANLAAQKLEKIRPVSPVPGKRKVEPCKFLSVKKFVQTRINGVLVLPLHS